MDREYLLNLPFDLYGRYATISMLVNQFRQGTSLKILDVGGYVETHGACLLQEFLPRDSVVVLDQRDCEDKNYIKGDALQLPFPDEEFDFVVSADVLEHIQPWQRVQFLAEQVRVTKKYIILAAPFYSELTEKVECEANEFYRILSGEDHKYLKEHIIYGLPKQDQIEHTLVQQKLSFQRVLHGYLPLWRILTKGHFYAFFNPHILPDLHKLDRYYNTSIFPRDRQSPAYRINYLIVKGNETQKVKEMGEKDSIGEEEIRAFYDSIWRLLGKGNTALRQEFQRMDHLRRRRKVLLLRNIRNIPILSTYYRRSRNLKRLFLRSIEVYRVNGAQEVLRRARFFVEQRGGVMNAIHGKAQLPVPSKLPIAHSRRNWKVLFVLGCDAEAVRRYRVTNIIELLSLRNIEAAVISEAGIREKMDWITNFPIVVFSRTTSTPLLVSLRETLQKLNIITIFEIDDLLFDEDALSFIDAIKGYSKVRREGYREMSKGYRAMLHTMDYFLTTTDYLAEKGREEGKKAFVMRNNLNQRQIDIAHEILKTQRKNREADTQEVVLGYFSGSRTHEADFSTIAPVLSYLLDKYRNLTLHIGGHLEFNESFKSLGDRVRFLPFVPWEKLPFLIAQVDINLVPLEWNNPFCEGKSELKYFEAGILKIPTVATATDSFRYAIVSGKNGFLARNSMEWCEYLETLIVNRERRMDIGEKAYQHILKTYAPIPRSVIAENIFREIVENYCKKK